MTPRSAPRTPRSGRHARRALLGLLVPAVLLAGCTRVGDPDTPAPPEEEEEPSAELVAYEYGGTLSVQGSRLPVVLSMVARGDAVRDVVLRIPEISMVARGDGSLEDGRLELDLRYGDECEGEARILAQMEQDGRVVHGTLSAEDCTGSEEGALELRVR